jgi:beta-N-acetylhexosaminidase
MTLEQLALRVLLPSFAGTVVDDGALRLLGEGLGGLCLFGSNTADGPDAVAAYAGAVRDVSPAAVLAIDEEGGDVTRLHAITGSPFLGAAALGAADDLELTRATARAIGAELAGLGLDLALGPVADVNTDPDNPVIGVRSFGAEPQRAAAHVAAWVEGLQSAGPAACAKHFPGHGDTRQDSHVSLPEIDAPLDLLSRRELVPFRAAVAAGVEAVMTSHIVVRALDSAPATLSAPVLSLLRARPETGGVGFAGTIVSDALDMAGASAGRGIPRAAVLSLVAGADLLCLGPDKEVELVRAVQDEIVTAVKSGELAEKRLVEAAGRVDRLASRPLTAGGPAPVEELGTRQFDGARAALRVEGELPDLHEALLVSIETAPNIAVGPVPWGLPADLTIGPDGTVPPGSEPIIVQVREAHRRPDVRALLERLAAERCVVLLEWGWPGDLGPVLTDVPRLVPFGSSQPSIAAVAEVLHAAGWDAPC